MSETTDLQNNLYLTFRLGDELFAIDVSEVREVLDIVTITKVPRTPEFFRGVINVRGSVVPVIDLRIKFGLSKTEHTMNTRIVLIEVDLDGERTVCGALADSVHEVIELAASQIEPPPSIGARWRSECIKGIGKRNNEFIIMLDIKNVVSIEDLRFVDSSAERIEALER